MLNMRLHSDGNKRPRRKPKAGDIVNSTKVGKNGKFIPAGHIDADGNFIRNENRADTAKK